MTYLRCEIAALGETVEYNSIDVVLCDECLERERIRLLELTDDAAITCSHVKHYDVSAELDRHITVRVEQ